MAPCSSFGITVKKTTPMMNGQSGFSTSDKVCANAFSSGATAKILALKRVQMESLGF